MTEKIPKNQASVIISKQLIRSSTSPALNYAEARSAESRRDFIHKMKICLKELRETHVILLIIITKPYLKSKTLDLIIQENNELISIFVSSINTANKKLKSQ